MSTPLDMAPIPTAFEAVPRLSTVRDYITLMKPGVMLLVVFTGWAGMVMAPGHVHPFVQCIVVLSIALGSGAGAAINMWFDRDIDAIMQRTQKRPLPAGVVAPDDVLTMGIALSVCAVSLLGLAVNWLAAGILAFAIFFYAVIYTMILKRATPQNIVIGGAAGAFPPVIGWAAVTGDVTLTPWILFAITFLWTPPHFWALALYRSGDYTKAGVPMLPVTAGIKETKRQIVIYTWLLAGAAAAPVVLGISGWLYAIVALALNVTFLWYAFRVKASDEDKVAKSMFAFSILYLFAMFTALVVDHWIV